MTKAATVCGLLLILVAFVGYGYGLAMGNASLTALIPLVFGVVLLALGFFAQKKDELRKTLMHIAVVVAFIGFLVPLFRIISTFNEFKLNFAAAMLISMTLICLIFVILAIKSFVDARSSRQS
jgi:hypothetical protein